MMQQVFDGVSREGGAARIRLPDLWELTRRFSGLAAIAVLGIAMLTLTLRAEVATPAVLEPPANASSAEAVPSDPLTTNTQPAPPPTALPKYVLPEPSLVFYLYETKAQRDLVMLAESVAGQEAATETVIDTQRQFVALDASTPALEQDARDRIFEAMLANDGRIRVVVQDLRGR